MAVPYTAATARRQVRYLLDESSAVYWTDNEINNWIKEACVDISTRTLCVEAAYGLCLKDGTMEYTASEAQAGTPNTDETDITFSAATPGSLSSGGNADWITDGFKHGMRVTVSNTSNNNGNFTIRSVPTEDSMTFFETTAAEGPGNADIDYIYSWIDDIVKVYGCVYHKGDIVAGDMAYRGLMQVHPRQIGHLPQSDDGEPYYWWYFQETLGVYPIPGSAQENDVVIVYHSKVTEDITELPDWYQAMAIWYAVAKARQKQGNFDEAAMFMSMYQNSMAFHRQDIYEKGVDSKDMFNLPDQWVAPDA